MQWPRVSLVPATKKSLIKRKLDLSFLKRGSMMKRLLGKLSENQLNVMMHFMSS